MLDFDSNALYEALKDVCDLTNTTITLYDDNKNSLFSYEPPPRVPFVKKYTLSQRFQTNATAVIRKPSTKHQKACIYTNAIWA